MNKLKVFESGELGVSIRTQMVGDVAMFCLKDIADALEYKRPADAVTAHCKRVSILPTPTKGGMQRIKYGKESEVYRLVMRSKCAKAEKFQDWVCDEVLPQINHTGGYIPVKENESDEDVVLKAMKILQKTVEKKDKLLLAQKPKVECYDKLMRSSSSISVGDFCKIIGVGEKTLFKKLRDNLFLCNSPRQRNIPFQKYIDNGMFEVKESASGNRQTLISPKGQVTLAKKFYRGDWKELFGVDIDNNDTPGDVFIRWAEKERFKMDTHAISNTKKPSMTVRFGVSHLLFSVGRYDDNKKIYFSLCMGGKYVKVGYIFEPLGTINIGGLSLGYDYKTNEVIVYEKKLIKTSE